MLSKTNNNRWRWITITFLTFTITLAKLSRISHLDPFANRLLDYPNSTPTITNNTTIPYIHLNSSPHPINHLISFFKPKTANINNIIMEVDKDIDITFNSNNITITNKKTHKRIEVKKETDHKKQEETINKAIKRTKEVKVANNQNSNSNSNINLNLPHPINGLDLLQEAYQELYGNESGHYGYHYDTIHPGDEKCLDGMGSIAGTYCAPNGKRYTINISSTIEASNQLANLINQKISNIPQEQLEVTAKQQGISTQELLDKLLQQTLVLKEDVKEQILTNRREIQNNIQTQTNHLNKLYQQATRLIDPRAWLNQCINTNSKYINDAETHCQYLLDNAKKALDELNQSDVAQDKQNPQYQEIYEAIHNSILAVQAGYSGYTDNKYNNSYQNYLDKITDTNLRSYAENLVQNKYSDTLSNSIAGCNSITSPDVRNACLSRYATSKEQDIYSYDGTISTSPTIQQTYKTNKLITEETKTNIDQYVSENYSASKLHYLIGQLDRGNSTTKTKIDSTESANQTNNYKTTKITNQVDLLIKNLSDNYIEQSTNGRILTKAELSCRAHNGLWLNLDPQHPCITQTELQEPQNLDLNQLSPQRLQTIDHTHMIGGGGDELTVNCGKDGQTTCNTGTPCDEGYYPINGKCQLDPQFKVNLAKQNTLTQQILTYSQNHPLPIDILTQLTTQLSFNNGLNPNTTYTQLITQAQSPNCHGVTIYSESSSNFKCITDSQINNLYLQSLSEKERNHPPKKSFQGKCSVWHTCNEGLTCNRTTNRCELDEQTKAELAQNFAFKNNTNTYSLDNKQLAIFSLNSTLLNPNINSDPKLIQSIVKTVPKDKPFFANGACWLSLDPSNGVSTKLPLEYCQQSYQQQGLLSTLPTKACHDAGGYYTTSAGNPYSTEPVEGVPNCLRIKPNSRVVGPGEKPDNAFKRALGGITCAPGLIEFNGVCREQISLAFDPEYSNGDLATKLANHQGYQKFLPLAIVDGFNEVMDYIPVFNFVDDMLMSWASSIARSTSPSYHQSIETRAEYSLAIRNAIKNHPNADIAYNTFNNDKLNSLFDEATLAKQSAIVAKNLYNSQGFFKDNLHAISLSLKTLNPFSTTEERQLAKQEKQNLRNYYRYVNGIQAFQLISAWTGEPPISRGGASGTNAFYEYASKQSELNTSEESYFSWQRTATALKPTQQAMFFAGDAITFASGFGKILTSTGNRFNATLLSKTGVALQAPERIAENVVEKTFLHYGNDLVETGIKKLITSPPAEFFANKIVTPIKNTRIAQFISHNTNKLTTGIKNIFTSSEKRLARDFQEAFLENVAEYSAKSTNTYQKPLINKLARQIAEKRGVEELTEQELKYLTEHFDDILHIPSHPSPKIYTSDNFSQAQKLIDTEQLARKWHLGTLTDDELLQLSEKYTQLTQDILSANRGPLTKTEFIQHFSNLDFINPTKAETLFHLLDTQKSPLVASRTLTDQAYAKRLTQLGLEEKQAQAVAQLLAQNTDDTTKMVTEYRSVWSKLTNRFRKTPTLSFNTPPEHITKAIQQLENEGGSIDSIVKVIQDEKVNLQVKKYNYTPRSTKFISDLPNSSTKAYRLVTPKNATTEVKQAVDHINKVIDSLERSNGWRLTQKQVQFLGSSEGLIALQAGGGKTSVFAKAFSALNPRSIYSTKTQTEALTYINEHILSNNKSIQFFTENNVHNIYYLDAQRGWLKVELKVGRFDPATALKATEEEITQALIAGAKGETGVHLITNRSNSVWTLLGKDPNYTALINGHFGNFTVAFDEISEDILAQFASSMDERVVLKYLRDPKILNSIETGKKAVQIFEEVEQQITSHADLPLAQFNGNYLPANYADEMREYLNIISQTEKKYNGFFSRRHYQSELDELAHIKQLFESASSDTTAEEAKTALSQFLDKTTNPLTDDLAFRKSSLQSIFNMRGRTPGVDYKLIGDQIILTNKGGLTGESFSKITDQLALHTEGSKALAELGIDLSSLSRSLDNLAISQHGTSMSSRDFILTLQNNGHTIIGLDATPTTASHVLGIQVNGQVENFAVDHIKSLNSYHDLDQLVNTVKDQVLTEADKAHFFALGDSSLSYEEFAKRLQAQFPDRTEIYIVQYQQSLSGSVEEAKEFIRIVDGKAETLAENVWNTQLHQSLANNPEKVFGFDYGRTRALDIKVTTKNLNLSWHQIGAKPGYEGSGTVLDELIQGPKRNRMLTERTAEEIRQLLLNDSDLFNKYTGKAFNSLNDAERLQAVNRVISDAQDFHLYLSNDYGLDAHGLSSITGKLNPQQAQELTQVIDSFVYPKLSQARLSSTLTDLASAPEKALFQLETLLADPVYSANLTSGDRQIIQDFINSARADANKFKSVYLSDISRTPLEGRDIYKTVYRRAQRAQDRLITFSHQLEEAGLNSTTLAKVNQLWGISEDLLPYRDFITKLKQPTTSLLSYADRTPSGIIETFVHNNSIAPNSNPLYQLAQSTHISPLPTTVQLAPQQIATRLTQAQHPIFTKLFTPSTSAFQFLTHTNSPLKALAYIFFRSHLSTNSIAKYLTKQNIDFNISDVEALSNTLIPLKLSRSETRQLATNIFNYTATQQLTPDTLVYFNNHLTTLEQAVQQHNSITITLQDGNQLELTPANLNSTLLPSLTAIDKITTTTSDNLLAPLTSTQDIITTLQGNPQLAQQLTQLLNLPSDIPIVLTANQSSLDNSTQPDTNSFILNQDQLSQPNNQTQPQPITTQPQQPTTTFWQKATNWFDDHKPSLSHPQQIHFPSLNLKRPSIKLNFHPIKSTIQFGRNLTSKTINFITRLIPLKINLSNLDQSQPAPTQQQSQPAQPAQSQPTFTPLTQQQTQQYQNEVDQLKTKLQTNPPTSLQPRYSTTPFQDFASQLTDLQNISLPLNIIIPSTTHLSNLTLEQRLEVAKAILWFHQSQDKTFDKNTLTTIFGSIHPHLIVAFKTLTYNHNQDFLDLAYYQFLLEYNLYQQLDQAIQQSSVYLVNYQQGIYPTTSNLQELQNAIKSNNQLNPNQKRTLLNLIQQILNIRNLKNTTQTPPQPTVTDPTITNQTNQSADHVASNYKPNQCTNCLDFTRQLRRLLSNARDSSTFGYQDKALQYLKQAQDLVTNHQRQNFVIQKYAEASLALTQAELAQGNPNSPIALTGERHQFVQASQEIQQTITQIDKDLNRTSTTKQAKPSLQQLKQSLQQLKENVDKQIEKYDQQRLSLTEQRQFQKLNPNQISLAQLQPFFTSKLTTSPRSIYAQLTGKINDKTLDPRREAWIVDNPNNPVALIIRTKSTGTIDIRLNRNIVLDKREDVQQAIKYATKQILSTIEPPQTLDDLLTTLNRLVKSTIKDTLIPQFDWKATPLIQHANPNTILKPFQLANAHKLLTNDIVNTTVIYADNSDTPQLLIIHNPRTTLTTIIPNPTANISNNTLIKTIDFLKEQYPNGFTLRKNNYVLQHSDIFIQSGLRTPRASHNFIWNDQLTQLNTQQLTQIINNYIQFNINDNNIVGYQILEYGLQQYGLELTQHSEDLQKYFVEQILDHLIEQGLVTEENKDEINNLISAIINPLVNQTLSTYQQNYQNDLITLKEKLTQLIQSGYVLYTDINTQFNTAFADVEFNISNPQYRDLLLTPNHLHPIIDQLTNNFQEYYNQLDAIQQQIIQLILQLHQTDPENSLLRSNAQITHYTQIVLQVEALHGTQQTNQQLINQLLTLWQSANDIDSKEKILTTIQHLHSIIHNNNSNIATQPQSPDYGDPQINPQPSSETNTQTHNQQKPSFLTRLKTAITKIILSITAGIILISGFLMYQSHQLATTSHLPPPTTPTAIVQTYEYEQEQPIQVKETEQTPQTPPDQEISCLDQLTQIGINPQVQQLITDNILRDNPTLNQDQQQLAITILNKYQQIAEQIGYEHMQPAYVELMLKGAILQPIYDNNGKLIANVLTYPTKKASSDFRWNNFFPTSINRVYGEAAIITPKTIDQYSPNPFVVVPQTDATRWLHSLTAGISYIQAQSSSDPQLIIDPFLFSELEIVNLQQQDISNIINSPTQQDLFTETYKDPQRITQALNYGSINTFLIRKKTFLSNALNITYNSYDFQSSYSFILPIFKSPTQHRIYIPTNAHTLLNDFKKLNIITDTNTYTYDENPYGNPFNSIDLDANQQALTMKYIINYINSNTPTPHAILLALKSVTTNSKMYHSVLFLGIENNYAIIIDGRINNPHSNPTTWNEYPGIKFDEQKQAYLIPLDTLFQALLSIDIISPIETVTLPTRTTITNYQHNISQTYTSPTHPTSTSSQPDSPNTTITNNSPDTTTSQSSQTIDKTTQKSLEQEYINLFMNILNSWNELPQSKQEQYNNIGQYLINKLNTQGYSELATQLQNAGAIQFLNQTSTLRDNQLVQCVALANLIQQTHLTQFNGKYNNLSAIGGSINGIKEIATPLTNSSQQIVINGSYGLMRVEKPEDLLNMAKHFFVVYNTSNNNPGHIGYVYNIITNNSGEIILEIYDSNYLFNGFNANGIKQVIPDGKVRFKRLTINQFIEQYGNIGPQNQSQIAILLDQQQAVSLLPSNNQTNPSTTSNNFFLPFTTMLSGIATNTKKWILNLSNRFPQLKAIKSKLQSFNTSLHNSTSNLIRQISTTIQSLLPRSPKSPPTSKPDNNVDKSFTSPPLP